MLSPQPRRFPREAGLAGLALAVALLALSAVAAGRQSVFRSRVDLVAVDVQVVAGDGSPLRTLRVGDFEVTIDGRARRVISSELIEHDQTGAGRQPIASGPQASNLWPDPRHGGRTFVLAIDAGSFGAGESLPYIQAARDFVSRLTPDDRVGVFTLPPFGPQTSPTADRSVVRQALDRVVGQRPTVLGQFNLSLSEVIDITTERAGLGDPNTSTGLTPTAGGGRAAGAVLPAEATTLRRVQARECRRAGDVGCVEAIASEAAALAQFFEERAVLSLNGLAALLDALRSSEERKTVVVISAGIPVSDRPGGRVNVGDEVGKLGEQAARANATIYALHVDAGLARAYRAESRQAPDSVSLERERRLSGRLLEQFAASSGGTIFPVLAGSGELALARVLREVSTYYLLGVEPASTDRDGHAHRLRVKVKAQRASIRSRQWVVMTR